MNGTSNRLFRMSMGLAAAFLLVNGSGMAESAIHPVAGSVMAALLGGHMILHRKWFMTMLRRANNLKGRSRTNLVMALALGVTYLITIVSGFVIVPEFNDGASPTPWTHVHALGAAVSSALTLWHLGLHWSWLRRNATSHRSAARHA